MPRMPNKVLGGRAKKKKNWLHNPEHRKIYNSARWRKLRESYIQRNPVCVECHNAMYYLDHIIPISEGGAIWDEDNMQGLCRSCNGRKTRLQQRKLK